MLEKWDRRKALKKSFQKSQFLNLKFNKYYLYLYLRDEVELQEKIFKNFIFKKHYVN